MQLCRLIYCSLTALHVSSDIFPHHQEHLNCIYSFWYYSRMSLPAGVMDELERSCLYVVLRVFQLRPLPTSRSMLEFLREEKYYLY